MGQDGMRVSGRCHCGKVTFEAELAEALEKVIRCICSYCRMKGSVMTFVDLPHAAGDRQRGHVKRPSVQHRVSAALFTSHVSTGSVPLISEQFRWSTGPTIRSTTGAGR